MFMQFVLEESGQDFAEYALILGSIAVVAIAVLAAAITPTVDPVNMGLVMAPLSALYLLSILLAALARRG